MVVVVVVGNLEEWFSRRSTERYIYSKAVGDSGQHRVTYKTQRQGERMWCLVYFSAPHWLGNFDRD